MEAVNCTVYILNHCPTKNLEGRTPQEAWNGYRPDVSHLRVFGCIAYAHIPDQRRSKLDDKSYPCIFIGYDQRSKAYKLYDPKAKKILISRDVKFNEEGIWNWGTNMIEVQEEEEQVKAQVEDPTPPSSPSMRSPFSSEESRKTRSIQDLYEVTSPLNLSCLYVNEDVISFEEAVKNENWRTAMNEEMKAIQKNNTWKLTTLPESHEPIGVKWIYKVNKNAEGKVEKYKARLVAKGYKQQAGIDYEEVFAPIA